MKYHKLPNSNIELSAISLGTWVYGGEGWGGCDRKDALAAIELALDCGVNFIDTAPIYGYGESEEIIGEAIKGRRDEVYIATKCGLIVRDRKIVHNLDPKSIVRELDKSLERLGVEYIDFYQCHWPDPNVEMEHTMDCLLELRRKKKIKHIGVSNFGRTLMREALGEGDLATFQGQYSLLSREVEDQILPFCREKNIGVLTYGSLGGGILSGKYKKQKQFPRNDARNYFYDYFVGDRFKIIRKNLKQLEKIGHPLNEIALNWVRQQPGVTSVIAGCRNVTQISQNLRATEWDLTATQLEEIGKMKWKKDDND